MLTKEELPACPVATTVSPLGLTLKPIIISMAEWGNFYKEEISKEDKI